MGATISCAQFIKSSLETLTQAFNIKTDPTMIKEIEKLKVNELEKLVFNPMVKHQTSGHPEILRIENDAEFTRIDFIYYTCSYYENGGWVQMSERTFIRPVGSKLKLKLLKAVNIPIAPTKHWFKTTKDILCYTLYFPPVPNGTKVIDIIEKECANDDTWFNFYAVSMESIRKEKLIVGN